MLVHIPNIQPYFNMSKFLVDLHTGDLLAQVQGKWYRLEVGCRRTGFVTENLTTLLEHVGTRLRKQLQPVDTDQTRVLRLDPTQAKAPPIPQIPNIHNYQPHNIVMSPTTQKNYIKDRTQAAVTYITEYSNTRLWQLEDKVSPESLTQRLQIVFGRTNAVREAVDRAIEADDRNRRKTNSRYLQAPTRFPTPDTMHIHEPVDWIAWMHEETQHLIDAINEEIRLLREEDDLFKEGTASNCISTGSNKETSEIPPMFHTQELPQPDKLVTPLIREKANNPLPQRLKSQGKSRNGQFPLFNSDDNIQGKPPPHKTKQARRQIEYNTEHVHNNFNLGWGEDTTYMQLPTDKSRTPLEQFTINGTPEPKICYRCGYEGHIKRQCNNHVYCDYCKTYSHHTSVCWSHQKHPPSQPVTSSRRNSPMVHAGVQKQQAEEVVSKQQETPQDENELSEITRKHLAQLISTMIPSTCTTMTEGKSVNNDSTQAHNNTDKGLHKSVSDQNKQQTVVNNFYIPDGSTGWKLLETGEIQPMNIAREESLTPQTQHSLATNNSLPRAEPLINTVKRDPPLNYKGELTDHNLMAPSQVHLTYNPNQPPPQVQATNKDTTAMMECMRQLQLTLQQHVITNSKQTEYHMSQNADLFTEMIKAQNRRELDPAMMTIPTFSGTEPEKCMDWINRIRNICEQSERPLRQELINKSEPVVQNFIRTLDVAWTDEEVIDEILKFFSDVPTPAHAIMKLRALVQGENEPIVTFNQKYRTLLERVEGKLVEKIESYVELEQYLGSIIFPIRKAIRGNIYWKSKHAPRNVGEAMKKAEELYMKHVYTTGGIEDARDCQDSKEVTINQVESYRPMTRTWKDEKTDEIPPNGTEYEKITQKRHGNN